MMGNQGLLDASLKLSCPVSFLYRTIRRTLQRIGIHVTQCGQKVLVSNTWAQVETSNDRQEKGTRANRKSSYDMFQMQSKTISFSA